MVADKEMKLLHWLRMCVFSSSGDNEAAAAQIMGLCDLIETQCDIKRQRQLLKFKENHFSE